MNYDTTSQKWQVVFLYPFLFAPVQQVRRGRWNIISVV
nr:MAG TPA: hypothetical protein [Caudoviricetes sp.]